MPPHTADIIHPGGNRGDAVKVRGLSRKLRSLFKTGGRTLLDLFYPPRCAACAVRLLPRSAKGGTVQEKNGDQAAASVPPEETHGNGIRLNLPDRSGDFCPSCTETLERNEPPFCAICGEPFTGQFTTGFACPNCAGHPFAFEFAASAWQSVGALREAIHRFKYGSRLHLRQALGHKLHDALADPRLADALAPGAAGRWRIVPVPLHSSRQRERGFNQSVELARVLARLTGLPCHEALRRNRRTTPQAKLDRRERLENLAGAFSLTRRAAAGLLTGKSILLIDDVLTTGSTTHECAAVLKKSAGAARVIAVTVAR